MFYPFNLRVSDVRSQQFFERRFQLVRNNNFSGSVKVQNNVMKYIISVFLVLICSFTLSAQVTPAQEAAARAELQRRGLSEDEVRAKLMERGIDIDNVKPEQLPTLQPILEEVIKELEAEKAAKKSRESGSKNQSSGNVQNEPAKAALEKEVQEKAGQLNQEVKEAISEGASVEEAVSESLQEASQENLPPSPIYGHQIFREEGLKLYRTTSDVKPPDSYVLGAGDEIGISIFGVSQADFALEINDDGYITPEGLPRIYLKGITYGQAKKLLRSRFAQYYVFGEGQFALSIKTARTITVNIFGEVEHYGSFTISAINTAFNALVAAGGPTDIGTVRYISVIRNGRKRILDVYNFLNDPTVQYDFFLENNDIIHVPTAERIVSISGEVKRPMRYELVPGENLLKLIDYAGGLTDKAYTQNIQVRRIEGNNTVLVDVNLAELMANGQDFELRPGDRVSVRAIPGRYENYASINGAVELPGDYEITDGMRVSDLVAKGILQPEARTDVAFLLRKNRDGTTRLIKLDLDQLTGENDLLLQPKDQLLVYTQSRFIDNYNISITGAVRQPTRQPFDPTESITLADLVLLAGGLKPDASDYAYIRRPDITNPKKREYIKVNVAAAVSNPSSTENIQLKPGDQVTVFTRARYTDDANVAVTGAVRDPGEYAFDESLRVSDVIYLSGGLTKDATDIGYIIRTDSTNQLLKEYLRFDVAAAVNNPGSVEDLVLAPNDRLQILSKSTFTDLSNVTVTGAVRNPGNYQFDSTLTLKDVLTLAGGLKLEASYSRIDVFRLMLEQDQPTRTIVATLQVDDDYNPIGQPGFRLQPYDIISVRQVPDFDPIETVTLQGEVLYPGVYALASDNEKLQSVIQRAGGLTPESFPEGATLFRNEENTGYIVTRLKRALRNHNSHYNYVLKPGDVITVPKAKDLVTINLGNTRAAEMYPDKMLAGGKINVAKIGGRRAKWYIKHYAAGFGENASRSRVIVEHPNGELRRTRSFLFFHITPKLKKGSVVTVGSKPYKPEKVKAPKERKPVDWDKVLTQVLATGSTIATIILALAATGN